MVMKRPWSRLPPPLRSMGQLPRGASPGPGDVVGASSELASSSNLSTGWYLRFATDLDVTFQDPGHGACEVARATWFKTRSNERLASYDASTAIWLLSDSAKVRYGARVELSPGFIVRSGGGGSVWLRLLELRMEDAGILSDLGWNRRSLS
ncbi:unnamed protein product [Lampetra fluviatilis]